MKKGKIQIKLGKEGTPDPGKIHTDDALEQEAPHASEADQSEDSPLARINFELEKIAEQLSGLMSKSWKMDWLSGSNEGSLFNSGGNKLNPPFINQDNISGFDQLNQTQLIPGEPDKYTTSQIMWSNLMPTNFNPLKLDELKATVSRAMPSDAVFSSFQAPTNDKTTSDTKCQAALDEPEQDKIELLIERPSRSPLEEPEPELEPALLQLEEISRLSPDLMKENGKMEIEQEAVEPLIEEPSRISPDLMEDDENKDEDEGFEFLSPDEMIARQITPETEDTTDPDVTVSQVANEVTPEPSDIHSEEEDALFLSPDEMINRKYGERLDDEEPPQDSTTEGLSSEDLILGRLMDDIEEPVEDAPSEERLRASLDLAEEASTQEMLDVQPSDEKSDNEGSFADPDSILAMAINEEYHKNQTLLSPGGKMTPMEVDGDTLEEDNFKQLDVGPILKKKDIYSPVEILDPNELQTEEKFVSQALPKETVIRERYNIIKILSEKRNRNTYKVTDSKVENKKLILKEYIASDMDRDEYRNRRDAFRDTVRILSTFKHPNLVSVYEAFTENYRDYYLMEVVEGLPITKLADMNTKPFSEKEVLKWGYQLCEATEFMHYRPTPFTLGDIKPCHVMVDGDGKVRITGYDLQRFFDVNRTLEFMPDNPKKLYSDVTKIARVLFFLLNKHEFDDKAIDIEWARGVSPKMRKLLEIACKTGQRTYGDIRVFKQKLEDTQVEDEEESIARRFSFPKINIDFSWLKDFGRAVVTQRPAMIAIEITFVIFLLLFSFAKQKQKTQLTEFIAPNSPIAWLSTLDELNLFDANHFNRLFKKKLEQNVSVMIPATAMIKYGEKKELKETAIILIGYEGSPLLEMLDAKNLRSVGYIRSEVGPTKMIFDEENRIVYSLHKGRGVISVVNLNALETTDIFLVGNSPVDMVFVPLEEAEKNKRKKLLELQAENIEAFKKLGENIPAPSLAVSNEGSHDLMFIDTDTGRLKGSIQVDGTPSQMTLCQPRKKIYLLDHQKSELLVVDIKRMANDKKFPLPGSGPFALVLEPIEYKLWVSMNNSDSLAVIDPFSGESKEIKGIGNKPEQIIYDRDSNKIWVLNQGTKDVAILDATSDKLLKRLDLGKRPNAICINGHRYFGKGNTKLVKADPVETFMPVVYGQLPALSR